MTPIPTECPPVELTVTDVTILGEVEVKNDAGNPVPVSGTVCVETCEGAVLDVNITGPDPLPVAFTPATPVERLVDGDFVNGAGTITIPDGAISYAVTVLAGGDDPSDVSDWVTIDGPDFAAPVPLTQGQSVSAAADAGNTLNGPITITIPAAAAANATWVTP